MPIYQYRCSNCHFEVEVVQSITGDNPLCSHCGERMVKMPTFPAMVKIKGEGGFPSRRKFVKGTAPYSGSAKAWLSESPAKANIGT